MPAYSNSLLKTHNIKLENPQQTKGIFMYWDDINDSLVTSVINRDASFVGDFSDPKNNKDEVLLETTYNDLTLYFNFNPGSNTTVSSQNYGVLPFVIQNNSIILTYTGNSLSDVLTFVLKSNDNTTQKTLKYTLGLTTENALPSGFSGVSITTRNNNYGPVQFSFNKNIDDGFGTVSSLYGVVSDISVSSNKMHFNYTTPNRVDDVLTFTGIKVSGVENTSPVTYQVLGLLEETNFSSFAVAPTSQNYSYNLQAEFSKPIATCSSITASSGNPTIITSTVVDGKVRFSWASLNTCLYDDPEFSILVRI